MPGVIMVCHRMTADVARLLTTTESNTNLMESGGIVDARKAQHAMQRSGRAGFGALAAIALEPLPPQPIVAIWTSIIPHLTH